MRNFDKDSTTDEVLEGIDLTGQRIVITGTSSGLGLESTRALASKGAAVTMLARDVTKNEAAADQVRASVPGADLEVRELDLTSLASVRACAEGIVAAHPHIDVLLNNAGVMCCPYSQTTDGFENQLGTNHLGHFLLSILLAPALGGERPSRLVELSSGAHGMGDIDFDDPMFERREYDAWIAYGQSKTANALFALEFDKRLGARGVSAYSVHPGMIMTELARHFTPELMAGMQKRVEEAAREAGVEGPVDASAGMTFKSVEAGAATQCWAATAPELAGDHGKYLGDCQVGVVGENVADHGVEAYAQNPESAARLWTLSEQLVAQKLDA
jgi:NAD(P)-dependent dehydrogenase (short-subunit alcohol dehydrogenase family)